jgi:hypothetical protein
MERIAGLLSLGQKNSTALAPSETLLKLLVNDSTGSYVQAQSTLKGDQKGRKELCAVLGIRTGAAFYWASLIRIRIHYSEI